MFSIFQSLKKLILKYIPFKKKKYIPKEIYSLEIWLVDTTYYLRAYSVTVVGLRDAADNPIHIIDQANVHTLGHTVIETLKESQQGIPHPDFTKKQTNEMLKVTGMKSEKKIMKEGKTLTCYLKDNSLEITSWYFDGKAMSSTSDRDTYSSLDPQEITKAVLEAFERCHP